MNAKATNDVVQVNKEMRLKIPFVNMTRIHDTEYRAIETQYYDRKKRDQIIRDLRSHIVTTYETKMRINIFLKQIPCS